MILNWRIDHQTPLGNEVRKKFRSRYDHNTEINKSVFNFAIWLQFNDMPHLWVMKNNCVDFEEDTSINDDMIWTRFVTTYVNANLGNKYQKSTLRLSNCVCKYLSVLNFLQKKNIHKELNYPNSWINLYNFCIQWYQNNYFIIYIKR